jgi:hypothetical protein
MNALVAVVLCLNRPLFLQHLWHRRFLPLSKHPHLPRLLPQHLALQPSLLASHPPLMLPTLQALHPSSRRTFSPLTSSLIAQPVRRGRQRVFCVLVTPNPGTYSFPCSRDLFSLCFFRSVSHGVLLVLRESSYSPIRDNSGSMFCR